MPNQNCRISRYAAVAALVFLLGIFVPGLMGLDGFDGGFALAVGSGFLCMIAIVTALVYASLARAQDKLMRSDQLLAHWTYSDAEQKIFAAEETVRDTNDKKMIFGMVAFFALLAGLGFWILDPENGIFVLYVMLGLIALIGVVAFLTATANSRRLHKPAAAAWISRSGAYANGQMHSWTLVGGALLQANYVETEQYPMLKLEYLGGNTEYTARIPVPDGKAEEAKTVINELQKQIKK